jgi:hypothetical protein
MRALIEAQQFHLLTLRQFYLEHTLKTHGYMYQGQATPAYPH